MQPWLAWDFFKNIKQSYQPYLVKSGILLILTEVNYDHIIALGDTEPLQCALD